MVNNILNYLIEILIRVISINIQNEKRERKKKKKTCKYPNLTLNITNTHMFLDCTDFEGQIHITNDSFNDMKYNSLDALKSLETIKGQLTITAFHPLLTNLYFLENLQSVASISGKNNEICIVIQGTSLKTSELPSLRTMHCNVWVLYNRKLCYGDQWLRRGLISKININNTIIMHNNLDGEQCSCNVDCKAAKCWGPGPKQCYKCNDHIIMPSNEQADDCNDTTHQPETTSLQTTSLKLNQYLKYIADILVKKFKSLGTHVWYPEIRIQGFIGSNSSYGDGGMLGNFCCSIVNKILESSKDALKTSKDTDVFRVTPQLSSAQQYWCWPVSIGIMLAMMLIIPVIAFIYSLVHPKKILTIRSDDSRTGVEAVDTVTDNESSHVLLTES